MSPITAPEATMSPQHLAVCELSLAKTYQRYDKPALVRQCAVAVLNALVQSVENIPMRIEAMQYLAWADRALEQAA